MFPILYILSDFGLLVVRVALGIILLVHGLPKIKNLKVTAHNFDGMGFKPGRLWGTVAAIVEFAGGIALILGFWVQLAALFVVGEFLVINVWKITKRQPFVGGWEFDLLILAAAIVLFSGGGVLSLDRFFSIGAF